MRKAQDLQEQAVKDELAKKEKAIQGAKMAQ
jgi:hypothetical protein